LRIAVFIVEQDCPYQELDGKDQEAFQLIVKKEGEIIGTLRILKAGIAYPEIAIGRVVSANNYRHLKLGHLMMREAMLFIKNNMNNGAVRLSAQSHLTGFYGKSGFIATGKEYLEDGIPHCEMLFKPYLTN